jgi:hypothetical protein
MLLRITNGTTTITLNDNSVAVASSTKWARYVPTEGDGVTVTETIEMVFDDLNTNILTAAQDIRRLLQEATEHNAATVYLEYRETDAGDVQRSPVLSGKLVWSPDMRKRNFSDPAPILEAAIIVTREDYWEGVEASIGSTTIRNGTTSPYNVVSLTTLPGNLPTPIKVTLSNQNGADLDTRNLYLAVDSFAGVTSSTHLIAGGAVSWTGAQTHNILQYTLTVPAAVISGNAGNAIHVLAAFSAVPSSIYMRASLYSLFEGVYEAVNHGAEVYLTGQKLVNLGVLEVPKKVTGGLVLAISVYAGATGSATLTFAQVVPAKGAVHLTMGYEWDASDVVAYDGPEDAAYYVSGGTLYPIVRKTGGPLMVWPDRTNRLHVLFDEGTAFDPSRQTSVVVTARPRRSTV